MYDMKEYEWVVAWRYSNTYS